MKPDQQRVCDIVMQTVIKLCESGLEGTTARVQGVIGVTVDDNDVFVIHINDTVHNLSAGGMVPSHCENPRDISQVSGSPAPVFGSPAGCSSARKRARHRLVFESPDTSSHRRNELVESERHGGLKQACSEASHSTVEGSVSQLEPVSKTDWGGDPKKFARMTRKQAPVAKSSVVIVDSDDEDVKLVTDQDMSVLSSKPAVCEEFVADVAERENFAEPVSSANAVNNLCIADVVGSVSGWSLQQDSRSPLDTKMSTTVIKDDLNSCHDDEDVTVMEEEACETTESYATETPPRQFQVTVEYPQCKF